MENKYKIIALYGASGVGKDTVLKEILKAFPDVHRIIGCTTRPKRELEEDGKDYFFLSQEDFTKKLLKGELIDAECFNNWFYGNSLEQLDKEKVNIGIFNLDALNCIAADGRLDVTIIRVWATEKERLMRALMREEQPNCLEICRRFLADEKAYSIDPEFEETYYINTQDKPFDKGFWARVIKEK